MDDRSAQEEATTGMDPAPPPKHAPDSSVASTPWVTGISIGACALVLGAVAGPTSALIEEPGAVFAVLLVVLALLFAADRRPKLGRVFKFVPLLVFAYFVPTVLFSLGLIPTVSPAYALIKMWMLPASLVLLVLSVDVPAILRRRGCCRADSPTGRLAGLGGQLERQY